MYYAILVICSLPSQQTLTLCCCVLQGTSHQNLSLSTLSLPTQNLPLPDQPQPQFVPMIARAILSTPGPFATTRMVQRRVRCNDVINVHSILQTMGYITYQLGHENYVGEYKMLSPSLKVFFKCPPEYVSELTLRQLYKTSMVRYKFNYYRDGRPKTQAPREWDDYCRSILKASPFMNTVNPL